jgi:glycosyltransferase involved in cell wall biosynthesis
LRKLTKFLSSMSNLYPRVLIFGQPFNNYSGGGITLTNLFKGWPKDKIAVAYMGHGLYNVTTDVCDTYYQLGKEEHKWSFPLNLFQKSFPSGLKSIVIATKPGSNRKKTGIRDKFINRFFYPALKWLGIFHQVSKIIISESLKNWLSEFNPHLLYVQVSSRETLLFAMQLIDFLKIPAVNHVMDDWPSTFNNKGLLGDFWHKKIDAELRQFNDKIDLHLSISEAMSDEYFKRYNKEFIPFHNPVESEKWFAHVRKDYSLDKENITILYSGRIGIGISESLMDIASAIDSISDEVVKIKLHIQTFTKDPIILNKLQKFNCVVINSFVVYEQLPKIFSEADILLLANDFSLKGLTYLKLSMPTKASEYMISGTPVLLYAPRETAISKFFIQNDCGCCVTERSSIEIINALKLLINDENYRKKISQNAMSVAAEKFDQKKVSTEFQRLLMDISKKTTG